MTRLARSARAAVSGWNRFWFSPQSTATLGLIRICFGVLAFFWTLSLAPTLGDFFGERGVLPAPPPGDPGAWGLLGIFTGDTALTVIFLGLLAASACLAVGYRTRLASLLVLLGIMAFERRNTYVFNSGDGLLRILALCLVLAPAGAALSLDRWRKTRDRFWDAPVRVAWALRLLQVQVSILYLAAVWAKVRGATWNDGTAISFALRLFDTERFAVPGFMSHMRIAVNLQTYATLAIELSLAILIWNRRLRPWVIALGVCLHLGIDWSLRVGFFSLAIFVSYLSFLPPAVVERWAPRVAARLPPLAATRAGRSGAAAR